MLFSYYYEGDKNGHVLLKMQIVADGMVASIANFLCMLIGFERFVRKWIFLFTMQLVKSQKTNVKADRQYRNEFGSK